ncbi:MAG: peptidoglycan DD-metalloendopeptidase family protein [Candidatus Pacebacteria bacterium]|nr:peptidoglycan DD-metalloendopeptidase family protein [Candidatus Paceibacterota bacterium]
MRVLSYKCNLFCFIKINEANHQRLIKPIAQDPSDSHQSVTYSTNLAHIIGIGVLSFMGLATFFNATDSSAESVLRAQVNETTNSQTIDLLSPNYALTIPQAIGGPSDIVVNDRLALLSPQVGIVSGTETIQKVEVDPSGIVTYVVQKGDTLSEIAEKFDVSVNTIKWENDLGKTLKVGKELRILPVTGIRHTIKKGDTFGGIAKRYGVETEDITVFNNIDATKLQPGKKIIIPNGVQPKASSSSRSSSVSAKVASVTTASLAAASGEYITPTAGPITSRMGPRYGRYHYGVDYGAPTGTPIVATRAGTITKTSCGSGYGKCLVIQHDNGTHSLYAHASRLYVTVGTQVKQGQKIAAVGSTGRSTGPHLHFEIRNSGNGRALNPLKLIK